MHYAIHNGVEAMHIQMDGCFTFADSHAFQHLLDAIRHCNQNAEIRLNIEQLDYIDATALGLLMDAYDTAKRYRHALVFEQPHGQVQESLIRAARVNAIQIAA